MVCTPTDFHVDSVSSGSRYENCDPLPEYRWKNSITAISEIGVSRTLCHDANRKENKSREVETIWFSDTTFGSVASSVRSFLHNHVMYLTKNLLGSCEQIRLVGCRTFFQ